MGRCTWKQHVPSGVVVYPLRQNKPEASGGSSGSRGVCGAARLHRVSSFAPLSLPALPLCCQAQASLLRPSPAPAKPGNFQLRGCEESWGREAGVPAAPPAGRGCAPGPRPLAASPRRTSGRPRAGRELDSGGASGRPGKPRPPSRPRPGRPPRPAGPGPGPGPGRESGSGARAGRGRPGRARGRPALGPPWSAPPSPRPPPAKTPSRASSEQRLGKFEREPVPRFPSLGPPGLGGGHQRS